MQCVGWTCQSQLWRKFLQVHGYPPIMQRGDVSLKTWTVRLLQRQPWFPLLKEIWPSCLENSKNPSLCPQKSFFCGWPSFLWYVAYFWRIHPSFSWNYSGSCASMPPSQLCRCSFKKIWIVREWQFSTMESGLLLQPMHGCVFLCLCSLCVWSSVRVCSPICVAAPTWSLLCGWIYMHLACGKNYMQPCGDILQRQRVSPLFCVSIKCPCPPWCCVPKPLYVGVWSLFL